MSSFDGPPLEIVSQEAAVVVGVSYPDVGILYRAVLAPGFERVTFGVL